MCRRDAGACKCRRRHQRRINVQLISNTFRWAAKCLAALGMVVAGGPVLVDEPVASVDSPNKQHLYDRF
jgi:hypothetical protein